MRLKKLESPKRKLIKYFLYVIFIVLLLNSPFKIIQFGINRIFYPIQKKIFLFSENLKYDFVQLKQYKKTIMENEKLKMEIEKLNVIHNRNLKLETENIELRSFLNMKTEKMLKFKVARLELKDTMSYYETAHINLGYTDGVKKNMIVLKNKTLLGRVKTVYENHSVLELVTRQNIYTSVITGKNRVLGILRGTNSDFLSLENISIDKKIDIGEKIYTSGISDIYDAGIYIGKIVEVKESDDELFKKIIIKQNFNLYELKNIILIEKIEK